jgi:hypothetical protein
MATPVPAEDLPESLSGKAVPSGDLPEPPQPQGWLQKLRSDLAQNPPLGEHTLPSIGQGFLHGARQAMNLATKLDPGNIGYEFYKKAGWTDEQVKQEAARMRADPNYKGIPGFAGLIGATLAVPAGGTALARTLSGLAQGAVFSEPGERLTNAAIGTVTGGVLPQALSSIQEKMGNARSVLANKFLSRGARQAPLSEGAVEAAYGAGAIKPLSSPKSAYEKLSDALSEVQRTKYAPMMKEFEDKGVEGMNAKEFVDALERRYQQVAKGTTVRPFYTPYAQEARGIGTNIPATEEVAAHFEPNPLRQPLESGNFPLSQGESLKSGFQHLAKQAYSTAPGLPRAGSGIAYEDIAAIARQMQEEAVARQASKAPEAAAAFIPVKQEYGNLANAKAAAAIAATRAANRGLLGLPESMAIGSLLAGGIEHPLKSVERLIALRAGREHITPTLGWLANKGYKISAEALENLPMTQRLAIEELRRKDEENASQ